MPQSPPGGRPRAPALHTSSASDAGAEKRVLPCPSVCSLGPPHGDAGSGCEMSHLHLGTLLGEPDASRALTAPPVPSAGPCGPFPGGRLSWACSRGCSGEEQGRTKPPPPPVPRSGFVTRAPFSLASKSCFYRISAIVPGLDQGHLGWALSLAPASPLGNLSPKRLLH